MSVLQVIGAIVALGVLIIVHEGGHYFVARWCKMRVERFSLGFGPGILKWRRGETQFQLAPIPLGGFVQITGMNPHEDFDPNDPRVYPNRPTWQRFATIAAGPFTNLLFSIVLIFPVMAFKGEPSRLFVVSGHIEPEENAGRVSAAKGLLETGDVIVEIDGKPIFFTSPGALTDRIQEFGGKPVDVTVLRGPEEQRVTVRVQPQLDEATKLWRLGIGVGVMSTYAEIGAGTAVIESVKYPWIKSGEMLGNLYNVARRKEKADVAGPVRIVDMIGKSFNYGWHTAFEFLAFLNVALGLFNLLPVPALDGGRLVFLGYEMVTRRRPNPRVEAAVHMVGFVMLMLLFVFVMFRDIKGVFG